VGLLRRALIRRQPARQGADTGRVPRALAAERRACRAPRSHLGPARRVPRRPWAARCRLQAPPVSRAGAADANVMRRSMPCTLSCARHRVLPPGRSGPREAHSRAGGTDDRQAERVDRRIRGRGLVRNPGNRRASRRRRSCRRRSRRRRRGRHGRARSGRRVSGCPLWGWRGRRRGYRRRVGGSPRRKHAQRIDVVVVFGVEPDPEMDVRHGVLGLAGRARIGDRLPLGDTVAAFDAQPAEVRERRLVPAVGRDGHGEAVRGHGTGERDVARGRSPDREGALERDVDTAMLPRRVPVGPDGESAQHRTVRGPRPRPGGNAGCEGPSEPEQHADGRSRCPSSEHDSTVACAWCGGNAIDGLVTESRGRARSARTP
jgi:hypothetical protein